MDRIQRLRGDLPFVQYIISSKFGPCFSLPPTLCFLNVTGGNCLNVDFKNNVYIQRIDNVISIDEMAANR